MASTVALFTGLSGLNANARSLDVIGNNIANVGTTAFKSSRVVFADLFSRVLSAGTPPSQTSGGTNPSQVGFGVKVAGTQRDMTGGTISATGNPRDMAIEGNGFFFVDRGGEQRFTRAGNFQFDAEQNLTTISGDKVLGYGVDSTFTLQPGTLAPINIPIGQLTIAEPTTTVRVTGNLNASGSPATRGSVLRLGATSTAGFGVIAGATVPPTAPNVLETTSLLTEIEDPLNPGSGTPAFAAGQSIQLSGARKGDQTLPDASLVIDAATTVADLMTFFAQALGLRTGGGANPDGNTPGMTLDPLTGEFALVGNTGLANDLDLELTDIRLLDASGAVEGYPFDISESVEADGESVRTTTIAYDSLGNAVEFDITFTLVAADDNGVTWRYDIDSADDTDLALAVASGTLAFDTSGRLLTTTPVAVTIDRAGTGAGTPLAFSLGFQGDEGALTSLADTTSQVATTFRDGAAIGTLEDFAVDRDGTIYGAFSNTAVKVLGKVVLANFANPEGLIDLGDNLYGAGVNSGPPVQAEPGTLGAGEVVGGALETSNVDIGQEFINLVLASTGYNASSRVITTTNDLMDTLLSLI